MNSNFYGLARSDDFMKDSGARLLMLRTVARSGTHAFIKNNKS